MGSFWPIPPLYIHDLFIARDYTANKRQGQGSRLVTDFDFSTIIGYIGDANPASLRGFQIDGIDSDAIAYDAAVFSQVFDGFSVQCGVSDKDHIDLAQLFQQHRAIPVPLQTAYFSAKRGQYSTLNTVVGEPRLDYTDNRSGFRIYLFRSQYRVAHAIHLHV